MNYAASIIANFESCNAGVPLSLLHDAAVDILREEWLDDSALLEHIESGNLNLAEAVSMVNDGLESAGVTDHFVSDNIVATAINEWRASIES
jgi:hypothetical protein